MKVAWKGRLGEVKWKKQSIWRELGAHQTMDFGVRQPGQLGWAKGAVTVMFSLVELQDDIDGA